MRNKISKPALERISWVSLDSIKSQMKIGIVLDIVSKTCYWDNCLLQFNSYEALFNHLKESHINAQNPSLPRDCRWLNTCIYQTSEKKHIISHLRSHLDWRPYSCDQCNSRFKHEHEVRRHVDKIHKTVEINSTNTPWPEPIQNANMNLYENAKQEQEYCPNIENTNPMNDYIMFEIIAFALGFRDKLKNDNNFKNHILMMGLSLSIFEVPQAQLKRYLLDNFYQFLAISSSQNSGMNCSQGSTANMGYSINNFIQTNPNNQLFNLNNPNSQLSSHQQDLEANFYTTNAINNQQNTYINNANYTYNVPCVPSNNFNAPVNHEIISQGNNSITNPNIVDYRRTYFSNTLFEGSCAGYRSISSSKVKIEPEEKWPLKPGVPLKSLRMTSYSLNDPEVKKVPPIIAESKIITSHDNDRHFLRNDCFNSPSSFISNPILAGSKDSNPMSVSEEFHAHF